MPQTEEKSAVAAVVVTYNRLELLRQCVDALRAQTTVCDILIVDNASTDGTDKWLATQPDLCYRNTGSNLGGAGGFNYGMRWAVEAGYDYVWVMDDDTLPHPDALEKLMAADYALGGNYGWLSSAALWTDGTYCQMNLQRRTPYRAIDVSALSPVPSVMASFVSLLLKRDTIIRHGLPISDFFIWSDDWEYTRRISISHQCFTVPKSKVIHAMKSNNVVSIATDSPDRLPRYRYFYRNDVYLYRREGLCGWLWLLAKDFWHSLQVIRAGEFSRLQVIWSGFLSGCSFFPEAEQCEVQYESSN